MSASLPEDVHQLVVDHINSVVQLEILLLLRGTQNQWSAGAVSRELRIDREAAAEQLEELCKGGLLSSQEAPERVYRFEPRSSRMAEAINGLAAAYEDRRVTVITLIYSKPSKKIRVFADAFRLRRDDENG